MIYNIFSESSYEDQVNINQAPDKDALFRMVEFGITPSQTVSTKFDARKKMEQIRKKELTDLNNEFTTSSISSGIESGESDTIVVKMDMFEDGKIIMLFSNLTYCISTVKYSILDKKYSTENKFYVSHLNKLSGKISALFKNNISNNSSRFPNSQHVAFYNKGKSAAIGGFYDGKIILICVENQECVDECYCKADPAPINAICIDKDEEHAYCGNNNGNILVFSIISGTKWILSLHVIEDFSPIISIYASDELNLWASSSLNGYVSIFTYPSIDANNNQIDGPAKQVRSLKLPEKFKGDYVLLSSSPLPSVIIIDNIVDLNEGNEKSAILIYPLNGDILKIQNEDEFILSPSIIKDLSFIEYLIYAKRNNIYIRFLPNLDIDLSIDFDNDYDIGFISVTGNAIYSISQNGESFTKSKVGEEELIQIGGLLPGQ